MSQRGGKGAAAKGKKPSGKAATDEKHEEALQAVVRVLVFLLPQDLR